MLLHINIMTYFMKHNVQKKTKVLWSHGFCAHSLTATPVNCLVLFGNCLF